jgi:hypothetical protein
VNQSVKSGVRPTYQEILRSVGAWLDMRGYQEIRITEKTDGLVIEGTPADGFGVEPERLLLDNEHIQRFCDASRQNRFAPNPLSPTPLRPNLTLVPHQDPTGDADE